MEKKSFHSSGNEIQAYTPLQFDERSLQKKLTEEEILALIKIREEEGYVIGLEKGQAEGRNRGEQEVREIVARMDSLIVELEGFKQKKLTELFSPILTLALDIAKKVVHKEIELDEGVVLHVAREAMLKVSGNEEQVLIRVNPLDYEVIARNMDRLKEESGIKRIVIETTPGISLGGCIIETKTGEIDARIEGQIKEMEDVISSAATHR